MSTPTHAHPPATPGTSDGKGTEDDRVYGQQLRSFQIHAAVLAAGMVVIFLVNVSTNVSAGITGHWSAWWSGWALIGWCLGIAVHGLVVGQSRHVTSSQVQEGEPAR